MMRLVSNPSLPDRATSEQSFTAYSLSEPRYGLSASCPCKPLPTRDSPGAVAFSYLLAVAALSLPASSFADDENIYFTAQTGRTFATSRNIHDVGGSFEPGTTATSLKLNDSTLVGAKMGIYSRRGLLGLEGEFFRSHPNAGTQTQIFHEPTFGPFPQTRGASHTVSAQAINLILRQPISERFVAHLGVGPALYRSDLHFDNERRQTSQKMGLNTQLGITYFISKQLMVSAEWKHNAVRFHFPTHGTTEGFKTDYKANHLAIGISYAFDWAGPRVGPRLREVFGMEPTHIGPKD